MRLRLLFVPVALSLALLAGGIYLLFSLSRATAWLKHTDEVRVGVGRLRSTLLNAETGARGYAMTGDPKFLEPYDRAVASWRQQLENLKGLTTDNPEEQSRLRRLEQLVRERMTLLSRMRSEHDLGWRERELLPIMLEGERTMDAARATMGEMEQEEVRLDGARQKDATRRWWGTMALFVGGTFVFLLVLAVVWAQRRDAEASRRRAEDLARAREPFRRALEAASTGMIMVDSQGRIALANAQVETLFGYPRRELIGQPVEMLVPPHVRERHPELRSSFLKDPQVRPMGAGRDLHGVRKDGAEFPVEVGLNPLQMDGGSFVLASIVDISERKRIEEQRLRVQGVLELAHDAIIVRDAKSRVTYWNRGAEETYGWTSEEASGRVTHELLATIFPVLLEEIEAALERFGHWSGELVHCRKDGGTVVVESRWAVQREGADRRILEIDRDVTARRRAERAVEGERRLLKAVFTGIEDGITLQDEGGKLIFANASAARLIGFSSAEELLASPLAEIMRRFEVFDEEGRPIPPDRLPARAILSGESTEAAALLRYRIRATGEERWSDVRAYPVLDASGRVVQAINVFRDVTAEHLAEERNRFLLRAVDELNSSLDYESTLSTIARLAVPVLADYVAVDVVEGTERRRVAIEHVDPNKVAALQEIERRYPADPSAKIGVPQILRTGLPQLVPEIPHELLVATAVDAQHLDLVERLAPRSYMGVPLSVGGKVIGALTFATAESRRLYGEDDLAFARALADRAALAIENSRLFREVERARATASAGFQAEAERRLQAEEASRFADLFVGILGHDLRNPINAVLMTARLMLRRASSERQALGRILTSAERMSNMVTQLLDLTRTRIGGGIAIERRQIDLAAAVAAVVDEVRTAYPNGVILWKQPGPLSAAADPDQLAQVISNLLSNALEHGDPSKPVAVELSAAAGELVLTVYNEGPPIPTDVAPIIFDPFRRMARDNRAKGLGLGLFISQQIVLAHGGRIEVSSTAESGTTFTVRLPELQAEKLASSHRQLLV